VPAEPLVSICLPTFNSETWLAEAIQSALDQTWEDFELVISDNASTDGTLEIARSFTDPRIRLEPSGRNLGLVLNHNRLVELSRGTYVKFLHADDALMPTCLEQMVALAREDDRIGLVFAPREIVYYDENGEEWARAVPHKHEHLGPLQRINEGRPLFVTIVQAGIWENWIGEPTSVLVTRDAFRSCGLFNPYLRQIMDLEFWLRVMLDYRVGFIEEPLARYRLHTESATASDQSVDRGWLDRLWMLEGLLDDNRLGPFRALISRYRRDALRRARRSQVRRVARRQLASSLSTYLRFRSLPAEERRAALHPRLDEEPAPRG
jgi:glycosyltransferase involved in cell wall biosynthesis